MKSIRTSEFPTPLVEIHNLQIWSHQLSSAPFKKYISAIKSYSGDPLSSELLMERDGAVSVQYSPFEWVNKEARVVLVGITPGRTQAANALAEAKQALISNLPEEQVLQRAKATGAFSGSMRPNLVAMMDSVGLNGWLGLPSCGSLFDKDAKLLQTASVLQFPVFLNGENYNGTPDPLKNSLLRRMVLEHFGVQCSKLPGAVYIPLGPVPTEVLTWLAAQGVISSSRVLDGLPHPSGANAERIKYFLGQKKREDLSKKTDPVKLDEARARLKQAIYSLF